METATFGGGCFWCMEPAFQELGGVEETVVGYSGGEKKHASYYQVVSGKTEHRESVQVDYDPDKISYKELLDVFWRQIDPTDGGGQFADRGHQYSTAIFYHNEEQRVAAEESKEELELSGKFDDAIATEILPFVSFYPAEEEHQNFAEKKREYYKKYKEGSGRAPFLRENWGSTLDKD